METNTKAVLEISEDGEGNLNYSVSYTPQGLEGEVPKPWIVMASLVQMLDGNKDGEVDAE